MWGWIILAIIITALLLPVRVLLNYNADGFNSRVVFGPFLLWPFPGNDQKTESEKASGNTGNPTNGKRRGSNPSEFLPIVRSVLNFLCKLRRQLIVRKLDLRLILAGDDPCDLSVHYGETCAAVGSLQPALNQAFRIKKQNIYIGCDYVANETVITCFIDISITFLRLLILLLVHGTDILKQYSMIKNQRKGGTEHESKSSSNA